MEIKRTTTRTTQRYIVNGKTYESLDELPEPLQGEIRKQLEDKNGNDIPDIFEQGDMEVKEANYSKSTGRPSLTPEKKSIRVTVGGEEITWRTIVAFIIAAVAIIYIFLSF